MFLNFVRITQHVLYCACTYSSVRAIYNIIYKYRTFYILKKPVGTPAYYPDVIRFDVYITCTEYEDFTKIFEYERFLI